MTKTKVSEPELRRQKLFVQGYRITTAEILYRLPDYPAMLQSYVWQELDLAPKFPILRSFLDYWERNLDDPLYSVRVASASLLKPIDFQYADAELHMQ